MKYCETCKHLLEPNRFREDYACGRTAILGQETLKAKSINDDGIAMMYVQLDFGCVQHEEK